MEMCSVEDVSEAMLTAADALRLPQSIKIETEMSSPEWRWQGAATAIKELKKLQELSTKEFIAAVKIFEKDADAANSFVAIDDYVRQLAYVQDIISEVENGGGND